jgi:hypothetical protein
MKVFDILGIGILLNIWRIAGGEDKEEARRA